jgi:hypothetical protein
MDKRFGFGAHLVLTDRKKMQDGTSKQYNNEGVWCKQPAWRIQPCRWSYEISRVPPAFYWCARPSPRA